MEPTQLTWAAGLSLSTSQLTGLSVVGGRAGAVEGLLLVGALSSVEAGVRLALVHICGGQDGPRASAHQLYLMYLEEGDVSPW